MARAAVARKKTKAKPTPSTSDKEALLGFYRQMLLIRRFEERAGQLYGMGLIGGFCHLYIGQEAIAVGMQAVKTHGDQIITAYRDHGHMLACGVDPKAVMAELTGREPGVSKGKGGSMHMFAPKNDFYGGHGIVGAQVSLGTGPGVLQPLPQERQGRLRLFRRRRGQPGPGLRELQHGRALAAAGRLRDREQPVRHGHQRRALVVGDPPLSARRELQHPRRRGRRHGRDRRARRGRQGGRARPLRRAARSSWR